jgi:hypothetical protein
MSCSMNRLDSYPVRVRGTIAPPPQPLPKVPPGKHLDAVLLAVVRRRKLEVGVMPGVPFN